MLCLDAKTTLRAEICRVGTIVLGFDREIYDNAFFQKTVRMLNTNLTILELSEIFLMFMYVLIKVASIVFVMCII